MEPYDEDSTPRWPYPVILFLYALIWFVTPYIGATIGLLLYVGLLSICTWSAISVKEYEKSKENYPSLSRLSYFLNMFILPVVVPGIILLLYLLF